MRARAPAYAFAVVLYLWQRLRYQNAAWYALVLLAARRHYATISDLFVGSPTLRSRNKLSVGWPTKLFAFVQGSLREPAAA